MAQGLMDDFLVYKWQYMEDKKQTFIKSLESYLQNVRQKIFARSQDAEDHFVEAVAFLQQPLPDMKGQGSDQSSQALEERVKFLENSMQRLESSFIEKSEIHKQQVEKIEKHQEEMEKMEDKMKEQERMTSEQKEKMEKMEEKMKEQERRSASSVDELKNSFSDLQKNMEEEGNKLEKLKRETDEDLKKRTRQIKEVKSNLKTLEVNANDTTKSLRMSEKVTADLKVSVMKLDAQHQTETDQQNDKIDKLRKEIKENTEKSRQQMKYLKNSHKTAMRVCSERLASVGEIMKTVIQLHTATGTPFPTHAVAGPSSGGTTQATPTHAVAGPSSGVTSQATPTHAVAGPSSGVTTQATPTHAVAGPSSGVTTQATPTQAVAGPSSGVTTQATPTQAVAGPSSGVTTQATPTQAVAGPSSGVTTQATPTQAVAGVTTQATRTQATAASPGLSASAALTTSPGQDRTPTAGKLLSTLTLDVDIYDLLLLADGMLLVSTHNPEKLMLYDLSGMHLKTMSVNGYSRLCKDGDGCVFVLDQDYSQIKCLKVESKDIKVKATFGLSNGKNYYAITALDKTLAVSYKKGVDLINTNGTVLKTFDTDGTAVRMCTLPGGDLICFDWYTDSISRWNPTTGKRLFQTKVPEIPDPWGVASLPSRTILVGGRKQGTLSLIDERGNFIRHLYKSPSGSEVWQVSVQDDKCVLEIYKGESGSVQVIKLVY